MRLFETPAPGAPKDPALDSTLALYRDGYTFISKRCRRLGARAFSTRLLGRRVLCMTGPAAARAFYDDEHFERSGVMPGFVQKTLFGEGGVQGLDGAWHRNRKAMFLAILSPASVGRLLSELERTSRAALPACECRERVELYRLVRSLLCRVACRWAGVPLDEREVEQRAQDLGDMVLGFGSLGPRQLRGRLARTRAERWAAELVARERDRGLAKDVGEALGIVARHRAPDGDELPLRVAAVELLNVLRPIVAIDHFVCFAALALEEHPGCRAFATESDEKLTAFVEEVRRFYPFTPFLGARVTEPFEFDGATLASGTLVLLDVYGTLHDPEAFEDPDTFRPERFLGRRPDAFAFVPQGGGDALEGHRCPGEPLTVAVMKQMVRFLTRSMRYRLPPQDLRYRLSRIPALPASGVVLSEVRSLEGRSSREAVSSAFAG